MDQRTSKLFFITVFMSVLIFTGLLLFDTDYYDCLSREDHVIEYFSSILLFASSFIFLKAFLDSKHLIFTYKNLLMSLLASISILFFIAGGEEISWGQRIFNIATPEYLLEINDQKELNIHNINKKLFDRILDRVTIIFVIIGTLLLMLKKDKTFGIKNPNIYIICAFALTPFYRQNHDLDFYYLLYLPLVGLLINTFLRKEKTAMFPVITTLFLAIAIPVIHTEYSQLFPSHNNSANEFKEFLFCLCCLAYSIQIMKNIEEEGLVYRLEQKPT